MLQKQIVTVPLAVGLDQKTDEKQVPSSGALSLSNVRFYKAGKLQKRFGLVLLTNSSSTGNLSDNTLFNVMADDSYITTVTNNGTYALSEGDNQWYKQNAFSISGKVETKYILKNYFDQKAVDFDMTPDGTHAAYVARQEKVNFANNIMIVLEDLETGLVKSANIIVSTSYGLQRVIVVKDSGAVKVHVFYYSGTSLFRTIYDKDMVVISTTTIMAFSDTSQFDLCKDATAIYLAKIVTTSVELRSYDFAGAQTATASDTVSNSIGTGGGVAKGMSITTSASNLHLAWCRPSGVVLKGYTKALAPAITENSLGTGGQTSVSIISTATGLTVCSSSDNTLPDELTYETITFTTTYVSTFNALYYRVVICAQPFQYLSKDFVICRSIEINNRSFFLFNLTDGYIAQRFSPDLAVQNFIAGNTPISMVPKSVILNGVLKTALERFSRQNVTDDPVTDFFSTSGLSTTDIDLKNGPNDNSRQSMAGRIYLTSGATIEMDKGNPHENGFILAPNIVSVTQNSGTPNPNIASKTFSYVQVYEYTDSSGNITRSAPSLISTITTNASAQSIAIERLVTLGSLKSKVSLTNFSSVPVIATYRTTNGGTVFYKIDEFISQFNDGSTTVALLDTAADSTIQNNQILYTAGDVLQNDPAPSCRFSTAGGNRLFLGGLEEEDNIAYSKVQLFGESVAFSDFFSIRVSSGTSADKSRISGLGYLDAKLIIFRQNSMYYVQGDGPNETGLGGSFTEPEVISSDVGCLDPRSVVNTPNGLMFKSRKGIYLLDRGLSTSYVGAGVEEYNSQTIISAVVSDKYNEARFLTNAGNLLVYNFLFGQWSVFTGQSTVDADIWQNNPVSIIGNRIVQETENTFLDQGAPYGMTFGTPWYKLSGLQDFGRIWSVEILGTFKSAHTLRVSVYVDYNDTAVQIRDITPLITDKQYQYRLHLKQQKCESMRFVIQDISPVGESMDLSALTMEVGLKSGSFKLNAARKY